MTLESKLISKTIPAIDSFCTFVIFTGTITNVFGSPEVSFTPKSIAIGCALIDDTSSTNAASAIANFLTSFHFTSPSHNVFNELKHALLIRAHPEMRK